MSERDLEQMRQADNKCLRGLRSGGTHHDFFIQTYVEYMMEKDE